MAKRREAKHQIALGQLLKIKKIHCNYELKQTTTDKFYFSRIEKHQIDSLLTSTVSGLHWKYSDQDQRQKPFDGSNNPPLPGYLIIKFPKSFILIDIYNVVNEMKNSKSITFDRARKIMFYELSTG